MAITGAINVDEAAQTVQILFEENGQALSDHTYSAVTGRVTSPPLLEIALSLAEYEGGIKLFSPWLQMIRLQHNPRKGKEGEFTYELEKNGDNVKYTATLGGTAIESNWDSTTDIVTIQARDAFDLLYDDFLLFLSLTRLLVKKAKEF